MRHKPEKCRLDTLLVTRGLCESEDMARRIILAGRVILSNRRASKPGEIIPVDEPLRVEGLENRYVSRGGLKLEAALKAFHIDPTGQICLDIGASTGGFTDCLLQHGAAKVYAIDVGPSQMAWRLRTDPRVVVRDQVNARHLTREHVPASPSLAVADVSFISLTLILPATLALLSERATAIVLIKPQFELERSEVDKGGIVTDPILHQKAVKKIQTFLCDLPDWQWGGVIPSPITGTEGNQEFLACIHR